MRKVTKHWERFFNYKQSETTPETTEPESIENGTTDPAESGGSVPLTSDSASTPSGTHRGKEVQAVLSEG